MRGTLTGRALRADRSDLYHPHWVRRPLRCGKPLDLLFTCRASMRHLSGVLVTQDEESPPGHATAGGLCARVASQQPPGGDRTVGYASAGGSATETNVRERTRALMTERKVKQAT